MVIKNPCILSLAECSEKAAVVMLEYFKICLSSKKYE